MNKSGTMLILLAGIFWGSMGFFVRTLGEYGFNSVQIVCGRITIAAIVFLVIACIKDAKSLKIDKRDILWFLAIGWGSILLFTTCYFTAIRMTSMSVAAVLLYTSPVWVMLISVIFFHEIITGAKVMALLAAFAGCALVSLTGDVKLTLAGLLIGLCSGLCYGLYSIFGTVLLEKYSPFTVTAYAFTIASVGCLAIANMGEMKRLILAASNIPKLLGFFVLTAIITAVVPFLCYTLGLQKVPASEAAILATIEPVVATIFGAILYHEKITILSGIGVACILAAVVLLRERPTK